MPSIGRGDADKKWNVPLILWNKRFKFEAKIKFSYIRTAPSHNHTPTGTARHSETNILHTWALAPYFKYSVIVREVHKHFFSARRLKIETTKNYELRYLPRTKWDILHYLSFKPKGVKGFRLDQWKEIILANFRTCKLAWLDEKRYEKVSKFERGWRGRGTRHSRESCAKSFVLDKPANSQV